MTPETAPPTTGNSDREYNMTSTQNRYPTSESTTRNGGQGRGWGGCGGRGDYQGQVGRGGSFNQTSNTPSILNFKGEVE